ncbi:LPS translocon maturation chaperone LptM [Rickettsiella massiliensis]|nr:lipoprotein [Rickettsiella massiliensis]
MRARQTTYSCFLLALFLSACGQMGPLYLPDQPPPIHVPASSQSNTH